MNKLKKINLIPWREQSRARRKRDFLNRLIAFAVLTVLMIGLVHLFIAIALNNQNAINGLYQQEIVRLDKNLVIIEQIKQQQREVVARIGIIDQLQENRTQVVIIFRDMVKALPPGIYLSGIKREKDMIHITGRAESNARISTFIRHLEHLSWLQEAVLNQVQHNASVISFNNDFVLELKLKPLPSLETILNAGKDSKAKPNKTTDPKPATASH